MELANSIVTLQPGMYILRHPKTGLPPLSISRAAGTPAHNGSIQALYTPSTDGGILRDGRDCIVMQVLNSPVDLLVTAYLEKAGAAVPALKIDKVALDADAAPAAQAFEVPPHGISIIGHIERRGDLVATQGQRLGEAESNLRLEGFQVVWPDKPQGVELAYSANVEGAGETEQVGTGKFCGTRNAAKRLVGVTFTLTGKKAGEFQIEGDAHFSGGYTTNIGSGVLVQGPSGMEHLTGLRLSVVPAAPSKAANNPWEASARTRVLKSRSKK